MGSRWVFFCVIGLSISIQGCLSASGKGASSVALTVETIGAGVNGPHWGQLPGARWVGGDDAFASILESLQGSVLPAGPNRSPELDFCREGVLLVWMGDRPSGGYAIELMPGQSHIRDRVAYVRVGWNEPQPGVLVPQVLTRPYLMVRMGRADYQRIVVVDQHGRNRVWLDIGE